MLTDSVLDKDPLAGLQMKKRKRKEGGKGNEKEGERERKNNKKKLFDLFLQGTIPIMRSLPSGPYLTLPPKAFLPDTILYQWVVLQHMKFGGP